MSNYREWLADREVARREERTGAPADRRATLTREAQSDDRAIEAIEALDLAGAHVAERFSGEDRDIQHVLSLFIAAHVLWGR